MRLRVVWSVMKRDFVGYFTSLTGYVFITLFIGLCSFLQFWQDDFFKDNLATLATLNELFPVLLLFIVPAITMSAWADERRQGVDELLLTLPVTDFELVLGKYLGALGIYTVSLLFSLTLVGFLSWLGNPDPGLIFSNYYAFWLLGAALLAIGMVGSLLTDNLTVGFILGSVLCAVPVFVDRLGKVAFEDFFNAIGAAPKFEEMTRGVVPVSSVLYFLVVALVFLYLNLVLVSRRRWRVPLFSVHVAVRAAGVFVAGLSIVALIGRMHLRADCTSERLHSLSETTRKIVGQVDPDNPVLIRAYVSKHVPRQYVETRENLLNMLREYAAIGGSRVRLNVIETEQYTEEARQAESSFQILPIQTQTEVGGRSESTAMFLGVAVTCGADEIVTPFFYNGLPIEYELTRSIRVVSRPSKAGSEGKGNRLKAGVLDTDCSPAGGFDMQTFAKKPSWRFVDELKLQYEVVNVPADADYPDDLAVLIAIQPSSLTEAQMQKLGAWVKKQKPTLILDDPFPASDWNGSIASDKDKPQAGGMMGMGRQPEPKGNFRTIMALCGIRWEMDEIAWDTYNPHPVLATVPPEFLFIGPGNGSKEAFNPHERTTDGLQEVIAMYSGCIEAFETPGVNFIPLLRTGKNSGSLHVDDFLMRNDWGQRVRRPGTPKHVPSETGRIVAARCSGMANVIFVADVDFITDQFFDLRGRNQLDLDNISFFLNCVDQLAGEDAFIELRKRRRKHRTLERLEAQERVYTEERLKDEKKETEDAEKKIKDYNDGLMKLVDEIRNRTDLDGATKIQMVFSQQERMKSKLEEETRRINDEKKRKIDASISRTNAEIKKIQDRVKLWSLLLPPIPALLIGLAVFFVRLSRERGMARGDRWVGGDIGAKA